MIIGVDGSLLQGERRAEAWHLQRLIEALSHVLEEDKLVVWMNSPSSEERARVFENRFVEVHATHYPWAALRMTWSTLGTPGMESLVGRAADAFLFGSPLHPPLKHGAAVTIVGDLSAHLPGALPDPARTPDRLTQAVRGVQHAALALTPSEWNRTRWEEAFPGTSAKVRVVPPGVGDLFRRPPDASAVREVLGRHEIEPPYFLAAGTLEPRKNLLRLVHAFLLFRKRTSRPPLLVLAGNRGSVGKDFLEFVRAPALSGKVRWIGEVSEGDLAALMAGAEAFFEPSLSSGFGASLLEALAVGCPAAAAHAGALPETAGDAAFYVAPEDVGGWVEAMERLSEDAALREELARKGRLRAGVFRWEECAQQTLAALKMAAKRK